MDPPDFVGVGSQRAGTTWWYGLICDHPAVHRAVVKECRFFDRHCTAPDARILVLLRDPVERFLSGLRHEFAAVRRAVRRRRRSYIAAMDANDALGRSLYARQLGRLFDSFDRRQVLALQYERCLEAPEAELRQTYEFLGVSPPHHVPRFIGERMGAVQASFDVPEASLDATRRVIPDEVGDLSALVPEIDLGLWPSCRRDLRLASG